MASGSGWNLWVWLLGVVVRRYIDFLILLIPTPLVSVLFTAASQLFVHFFIFLVLYNYNNNYYISGCTSCRKCSKCFYVYLNIRPMQYSAMQI